MSPHSPLNRTASRVAVSSAPALLLRSDVRDLISLAVRGLVSMFDTNRQLFCHRLICKDRLVLREGISPRYTMMTLLGLRELERAGMNSSFDLQAIYASFSRNLNWIQGIGDLGLLIWLVATFHPDELPNIFSTFNCETALERYTEAQEGRTMELSWFLSGLAHAAEVSPKLVIDLSDLSIKIYRCIEKNQGKYGFFGHMYAKTSLAGQLRGRIGSFADQVYPIYALSKFAKVFGIEEPLGLAIKCATAVCRTQGELGQWRWLYDADSGQISSRYPVYSVHQHGMAPMALFALEDAVGQRFTESIYKGLHWIYGANELGIDMRDAAQRLIWRCVLPRNWHTKYWEMFMNRVRPPAESMQVSSLKILREQRPYEYGWLLFAFASHSKNPAIA
jgi:hypothetical protein